MTADQVIYALTLAGMLGVIGVIFYAWCVVHQVRSVNDYVRTSKQIWAELAKRGET